MVAASMPLVAKRVVPSRPRPAAALLALLLVAFVAPAAADEHVIPPGNDDVIAEMLGRGQTLPGGCTFTGGSIEHSFVAAQYTCAGGPPVQLELRHPADVGDALARTQQFAIVSRAVVPPELLARLKKQIAAGEARFRWQEPPTPVPAATAPPTPAAETWTTHGRAAGALAVLLLVLVLAAPLAVVLGVLGAGIAGLVAPSPAAAAWLSPARLRALSYLLVFLAVVAAGAAIAVPDWHMQVDEERDFILSALCAAGKGCPLVGNEMNQLRIKLGPLNRYLMTLCQLVTLDPRLVLWTILALHALAAAWLAAAADRMLRAPYGCVAGLLFGLNPVLLGTMSAASNGAWSSFFIVGGVIGTLRWVAGEPRGLLLAVTCLAAAAQLHGTNLALVPGLALAALVWRPPMPARVVVACVAVVAALYSSWLLYELQTGWMDFAAMSTGWMVSEGPSTVARLARAVPFLGGPLGLPLVVVGAWALLTGRATDASQRAVGCAALLLLPLPLAGTLLAGGGWAPRYGVPMIPPAAIVGAAGVRALVDAMRGRSWWRSRRAAPVAAAVVVLLALQVVWQGLATAPTGIGSSSLNLTEQIDAIGLLRRHGFGAADLESRIHGAAWDRWTGGHVYVGYWLSGAAGHADSGEHAVLVDCAAAPGFATWAEALPRSSAASYRLLGYRPQLSPALVELADRDGIWWSSRRALPFYAQMDHGGDNQLRTLLDPALAYPPEFANLRRGPQSDEAMHMRITTTLAPGTEDRALVLLTSGGRPATLSVDGVRREPTEPPLVRGSTVRARYVIRAAERGRALPIVAEVELPTNAPVPPRVDLFEEPLCAGGGQAKD